MAHRLSYPHHPKSTSTPYLCTKKHQQIGARASCPRTPSPTNPPHQTPLLTRMDAFQPYSGAPAKRSEGILPSYTTQPTNPPHQTPPPTRKDASAEERRVRQTERGHPALVSLHQQNHPTKPHHQRVWTLQPKSGESAKRSEGILPSYTIPPTQP